MTEKIITILLSLIAGLAGGFSGYFGILKQIKQTRVLKWVDDFRNEVSLLTTHAAILHKDFRQADVLHQLNKSATQIQLMLDEKNLTHVELLKITDNVVVDYIEFLKSGTIDTDGRIEHNLKEIVRLTKEIVNEELAKANIN